eukprot:TRINITY_DN13026_c0_g1_i1.p1 TRINITY_DN13026_c0_g1~~TRINITY_DN13026_c0_g1_i1.p1  ORF type:complete len:252 (+),score=45.26 TRINITY_DN13026_c0_g1_i1:71-757(+)
MERYVNLYEELVEDQHFKPAIDQNLYLKVVTILKDQQKNILRKSSNEIENNSQLHKHKPNNSINTHLASDLGSEGYVKSRDLEEQLVSCSAQQITLLDELLDGLSPLLDNFTNVSSNSDTDIYTDYHLDINTVSELGSTSHTPLLSDMSMPSMCPWIIIRKFQKRGGVKIQIPSTIDMLLTIGGERLGINAVKVREVKSEAEIDHICALKEDDVVWLMTKEEEEEYFV